MNLQLVTCGDLVPTCGTEAVHTPIEKDFLGGILRMLVMPNRATDKALGFVLNDVALAYGYKNPSVAGESMGLVKGEDFTHEKIVGKRGPHKVRVLTLKGFMKFTMRTSHEGALDAQDWLASKASDLAAYGIAFVDQSASEADTVPVTRDSLKWLCDRVVALEQSQQGGLTAEDKAFILASEDRQRARLDQLTEIIKQLAKSQGRRLVLYPKMTTKDRKRMTKEGFMQSSGFLQFHAGDNKLIAGAANGLTTRCLSYIAEHLAKVKDEHYFHKFNDGGREVTYVSLHVLKTVYWNNWRSGKPDPNAGSLLSGRAQRSLASYGDSKPGLFPAIYVPGGGLRDAIGGESG